MRLTITAYDAHVEQLRDTVRRLAEAFARAGIEYRVIGGLAVFFHVAARDPGAARATRDVDVAVNRADLAAIIEAVRPIGFVHRHAAGVDMLVDARTQACAASSTSSSLARGCGASSSLRLPTSSG